MSQDKVSIPIDLTKEEWAVLSLMVNSQIPCLPHNLWSVGEVILNEINYKNGDSTGTLGYGFGQHQSSSLTK